MSHLGLIFNPTSDLISVHRSKAIVVATVLFLHALALWALQAGLLQRALVVVQEVVVPVSVLAESPPVRPAVVKAALPDKPAAPVKTAPAAPVLAPASPAPSIVTAVNLEVSKAAPAPDAPVAIATAPAVGAVAPAAAAVPHAAPKVELPSSTVDYLHNPKPKYPRLSQSRNEQGTVILTVLVGVDGRAREVAVKSSSGFELLDRTAREAVLGWSFVPGKRNGAPVEMSVDVPIPFRLTD